MFTLCYQSTKRAADGANDVAMLSIIHTCTQHTHTPIHLCICICACVCVYVFFAYLCCCSQFIWPILNFVNEIFEYGKCIHTYVWADVLYLFIDTYILICIYVCRLSVTICIYYALGEPCIVLLKRCSTLSGIYNLKYIYIHIFVHTFWISI